MKNHKKTRIKIMAIILSTIITTVSLSGPVIGAQTSTDTEEPVTVKSEEITEEYEEAEESGSLETVDEEYNTEEMDPDASEMEESSSESESDSGTGLDSDKKIETEEKTDSPESVESPDDDNFTETEQPSAGTSTKTTETATQGQTHQTTTSDEEISDSNNTNESSDNAIKETVDVPNTTPADETVTTDSQNAISPDFVIEDGVLVQYIGKDSVITVPQGITGIASGAFRNCRTVMNILLQDGITYIGDNAFEDCTSLYSIWLPQSITRIGREAFLRCNSLELINLPDSIEEIGYHAFYGCIMCTIYCSSDARYIINYAYENGISYYGKYPFTISGETLISYNRSDGSVEVPDDVKVIGTGAFSKCPGITDVKLPASVTIIEDEAFLGCRKLERITLPGVKEIGESAFQKCYALKSITIPEDVAAIKSNTFNYCYKLSNVYLSTSLKNIGQRAFFRCTNLRSIRLPNTVTQISDEAFESSGLESISIPSSLKEIGNGVFSNCSELKSVTIPVGVTTIAKYAFSGCSSLSNIELPTGTNSIGSRAFNDCSNLTSISIPASVSFIGDYAFSKTPNVVIHCPASAKYVIEYAEKWNIPYETDSALVEKITLNKKSATVNIGKSISLKATVLPDYATDRAVTWISSNEKIAKVNSVGTVTGLAKGSATITATARDGSGVKAACTITIVPTMKKPGNCHFTKWNNAKYSSCQIAWNKVDYAEGYQTLLSWTDGSHASSTIVKSNILYRNCTVAVNHVSQMKVRAFYTLNGERIYGPWSNVEYITPSPSKLTCKNASTGDNLKEKTSWNIIYGCNGYNVFITTNPNGNWYWNQSTPEYATETNAVIQKYRGSKLKRNTRYYVRIVTRRKRNGVFCTVPMPSSSTYIGSFIIK